MTVALLGNPNSGKTTLLNRLTGLKKRVGNFPGVTVERVEGTLRADASVRLADLPGVYALDAAEGEEALARDFLQSEAPDAVLNVLDATSMARGLFLTLQLLETGLPVLVALTMLDEAEAGGGRVNLPALSAGLGVPVVTADECVRSLPSLLKAARSAGARPALSAAERFARADALCRLAAAASEPPARARARRVDALALHPLWALPLFGLVMGLVFFLTFGPVGGGLGQLCGAAVEGAFAVIAALLTRLGAPEWLRSLLGEGVLPGLGAVLGFLPTVLTLFFLLSLIEDSGYMARLAVCADRALRRLGLCGRAFVPFLLGFGCTVPAILATRTLPDARERRLAVRLLPFFSCSAKLPVYALFATAFFPGREALVIGGLYALGVVLSLPAALLLRALLPPRAESAFLLELPSYRMPSARACLSLMLVRARVFVRCALGALLPASVALWLLGRCMVGGHSLLWRLSGAVAPLFAPLGFGTWQAAAALLTGLVAKEGILSAFGVLFFAPGAFALRAALRRAFTPLSACSFLTFTLLYPPCAAAFSAARRELGGLLPALTAALCQMGAAWLAACIVYNVGRLLGFS